MLNLSLFKRHFLVLRHTYGFPFSARELETRLAEVTDNLQDLQVDMAACVCVC